MRILFVVENYLPHIGGVEVVFSQLAEGLAKQGHEVAVITHRMKGTPARERLRGVDVRRVSCLGSRYLFTFLALPLAIRLAKDADIVHTTTFNGAPPAWIAARLWNKPIVITVHEVWLRFWRTLTDMSPLSRGLHRALEWIIYRLPFDRYVGVSRFTAHDLLRIGMPAKKVTHVYNAMDYETFNPKKYPRKKARAALGIPRGQFTYFAYGRPGVSKGFEYLIDAVRQVAKSVPGSKLMLMLSTDPAYRARYEELHGLIAKEGVSQHITLMQPAARRELPRYLAAADCVVVPSIREGFGYAALEPCVMGTPVVSTRAASLPEVVYGKFLLVPPRSSSALARAIISVSRGKWRRSPRKLFSLKKNISGYRAVYRQLLGQGRARTSRA